VSAPLCRTPRGVSTVEFSTLLSSLSSALGLGSSLRHHATHHGIPTSGYTAASSEFGIRRLGFVLRTRTMEFGFALLHLSETSEQGPWDFSWVSCPWGFRLLVWRMAGEMSGFHCMYGYLGGIELGRVISRILCRE
jgi:hypothetical protein